MNEGFSPVAGIHWVASPSIGQEDDSTPVSVPLPGFIGLRERALKGLSSKASESDFGKPPKLTHFSLQKPEILFYSD